MVRLIVLVILTVLVAPVGAQQTALAPAQLARIDSIFVRYAKPDAPGCALAVSSRDTVVLERMWGSANLEHAVPITRNTIFEAGSVSKQFTAAAVLRLAQQGKLSLDDNVRKWFPELPVYSRPITVRHLIHHTSGLRDWGSMMTIAGWPRGTRTYTHAHVLDILARQRSLNYPVGDEYLYSNSNYNLLAMIAERVSGKSLADFTREEFFVPLGMNHTGWRDDYARVVPGRAQAYASAGLAWRLQMPFENVYGNSSLLTTVGDLLRWNANFNSRRVGGAELIDAQLRRGKLTSGREIAYAGGVFVGEFGGTREIQHDGATAGYRAFLARYPDAGYSVALLCNAGDVDPLQMGRWVSEIVLPQPRQAAVPTPRDTIGVAVAADRLAPLAGHYRSLRSDESMALVAAGGRLRIIGGPGLVAISDAHFTSPSGRTHLLFDVGAPTRIRVWVDDGDTTLYMPAGAPLPATRLPDYVGTYSSEEAEVTLSVIVTPSGLVLTGRPNIRTPLTPVYADGFTAVGSLIRFTRGRNGQVDGFLVTSSRARNVPFTKLRAQPAVSR